MSNSTNAPRVWTAVEMSKKRKAFIVLAGTIFAFNASLGTSLPSGASSNIGEAFDVTEDDPRMTLLNSLYVLGFVLGPLFFGPLSEYVGRRPVLIVTYLIYVLFTLACALSPNLEALLVFRFFCGVVGSVPNSVLGGLYSDIYDEPEQRGNAMALFLFTAIAGPMAGPLFSGFTVLLSWNWVFYIATIVAGAGAPIIMLIPETYFPVLLRRVKGVRPQLNMEQSHQAKAQFSARKTFLRPISLLLREPIVSLTSIYLAVIYGVLFLFFQVYPIVFEGKRKI
ncbi:uncharacterized protein APUU_20322A [Aspergillus puulaauensis]|uniref:Major facilitator superfamily (MFS) profile domain-containing protein n=1 Tax=Aspergillus puulaauensis TaxID=1220207 RepID=A0A7R7XEN7_9EURO|nr:uncharacterized protein APUU_20322A [Aspergillus puulaauensis]BCS19890.1 hypothetical protein APUU_20322A [Aspergillus puulaauensis]